jgi:hypothetical protein
MKSSLVNRQIVSKQRVADHGEVLTNSREVNAMLDLVARETERIDSRFLEPACGDGNFLSVVLNRKLQTVISRYRRGQLDYERNAILAVSSIYGIDILEDSVMTCRARLFEVFDQEYTNRFKKAASDACRNSVRFILERNIVWGDALSLRTIGDMPQPIVFSEWSLARGSMIKRRDFTFSDLLYQQALSATPLVSDLGDHAFIPIVFREYPLMHFLEVAHADAN